MGGLRYKLNPDNKMQTSKATFSVCIHVANDNKRLRPMTQKKTKNRTEQEKL